MSPTQERLRMVDVRPIVETLRQTRSRLNFGMSPRRVPPSPSTTNPKATAEPSEPSASTAAEHPEPTQGASIPTGLGQEDIITQACTPWAAVLGHQKKKTGDSPKVSSEIEDAQVDLKA